MFRFMSQEKTASDRFEDFIEKNEKYFQEEPSLVSVSLRRSDGTIYSINIHRKL